MTEIDSGWIYIEIMEIPRNNKLGLHKYPILRFLEGTIHSQHDRGFVILIVS